MGATLQKMAEKLVRDTEQVMGVAVREKGRAQKKINTLFQNIMSKMPLLDDDRFWELVEVIKADMNWRKYVKKGLLRPDRLKRTLRHFTWKFAWGEYKDMYELMSFLNTYEEKVGALYKPLFEVVKDMGDDEYGDFCDSFPLHGREAYEAAVQGRLLHNQEEMHLGENYVRMTLEDSTRDYYGSTCRDVGRDEEKEKCEDEYHN